MSQERLLTDTIRVQTNEIQRLKTALKKILEMKDLPPSRRPIEIASEALKYETNK